MLSKAGTLLVILAFSACGESSQDKPSRQAGAGGNAGTSASGSDGNTGGSAGKSSGGSGAVNSGGLNSGGVAGTQPTMTEGGADAGSNAGGGESAVPPPELTWKLESAYPANQLWGSSESDIYGAGDLGYVEHSVGDGQWKKQTSDTGANLKGVWGSGPADIYVAADANFVMHSAGDGSWKHEAFSAGTTFAGVWGSGPSDVYAFKGGYYHATGGGMWSAKPTPVSASEPIVAMWGSSPTNVYAAGGITHVYHSKGDGTEWAAQEPGGTTFIGISGSGSTDIYVVSFTQLFHSAGDGKWAEQNVPRENPNLLASVFALSASAAYVGSNGTLFRSGGDGKWVPQVVDPAKPKLLITGIWATSPTNLYLATSFGIYHGTQ
jgi:hypothetical protein